MFFLQKFFGWKKGTSVVEAFLCKSWLGKQFLWHDFKEASWKRSNCQTSIHQLGGIFCCSQKVNVFFGILSPPFFGTQNTVPQNLQSLKNPIFIFLPPQKKYGSAQQKLPPLTTRLYKFANEPAVTCGRFWNRCFRRQIFEKGMVNKCLVNNKLKPPTNYWLILPAKSKGTNLICLGYFFQNGWRCFVLSLEVLGQIKLPLSVFVW